MACNENQQMSLNDFYVNQVGWTARWHQEDLSFRPHDYRPDRQIPLPREARVEQDESPTFRLMVEYLPSGEPAFRVVATREPVVAEEVKAAGADTAERPAQARKIRLRPLGK